jgi:hypothetical protein
VYGIHNNHDHIDEGERVKGDRGWEKGEGGRIHICVAQGWKFNILVAQCYTCMIKQKC